MTPEEDPNAALIAALSGTTLTNEGGTVVIANADGTLSGPEGSGLAGTWEVVNGQWCRAITAPERIAGQACQDVTINGNVATINGADWAMS